MEAFISRAPERDFLFSWDTLPLSSCPSPHDPIHTRLKNADRAFLRINTGHWFARQSPWTLAFLRHAVLLEAHYRQEYTYWHDQVRRRGPTIIRGCSFLKKPLIYITRIFFSLIFVLVLSLYAHLFRLDVVKGSDCRGNLPERCRGDTCGPLLLLRFAIL